MAKYLTGLRQISALIIVLLLSIPTLALPKGVERLLEYEQKYLSRVVDSNKIKSLTNFQQKEFAPESAEVFTVKSYWVSEDLVEAFAVSSELRDFPLKLSRTRNSKKEYLLLVHPESERFYASTVSFAEPGPNFMATATASSRTLVVWPEDDEKTLFFAKLSLDKSIGGVVRTIPNPEVARSVGTTEILLAGNKKLPDEFDSLAEFFGLTLKLNHRGGMILRKIPEDVISGKRHIMPMFALYSSPSNEKSPIEEMIEKSGWEAKEFVQEFIIRPFAALWVELVLDQGIAIEAHGQNVLLEIDKKGFPNGRFVFRDFGGFNIDLKYRKSLKFKTPEDLPFVESVSRDYFQELHEDAITQSLEYYFEGGFLYGLANRLRYSGHYDISYRDLQDMLKLEVASALAERGFSISKGDYYESLLKTIKSAKRKYSIVNFVGCEKLLRKK